VSEPIGLLLTTMMIGALAALFATPALAAGDANQASCPTSTTESPGFRSFLPDCRAYELVSPPYTQGASLLGFTGEGQVWVGSGGDRVMGASLGTFAGQESGSQRTPFLGTSYAVQREAGGWGPEAFAPPASSFETVTPLDAGADLGSALYFLSQDSPPQGPVSYYLRQPGGSFVPIGPLSPHLLPGINEGGFPIQEYYAGASADLGRVVTEDLVLSDQAAREALVWPGDTTVGSLSGTGSLYEYSGVNNAEPRLVGVTNQHPLNTNLEADLISQCGTHLGYGVGASASAVEDAYNAVSQSGFAVFFTAEPGPCSNETETGTGPPVAEVYARVEGAHTLAISEPSLDVPGRLCTGICLESQEEQGGHQRSPAQFAGASADGHRVFFRTAQPLVDADTDGTTDLYMAELNTTEVTRLAFVSQGDATDPTPGSGALVEGVSRVAEDGSRVYFVAQGVLTAQPNANGEAAQLGANNLYEYDVSAGSVRFVAGLAAGDSSVWSPLDLREVEVGGDSARFFVFASEAQLQGTGSTSTAKQLYEYDAATARVTRVSIGQSGSFFCPQTGEVEAGYNCNGNVQSPALAPRFPLQIYNNTAQVVVHGKMSVASDGTVVFISKNALTPQAVNGFPNTEPGFENIYEYRDGNLYLITPGNEQAVTVTGGLPTSKATLIGITPDASGVLFETATQLVPQDTDTQLSIYDARVDGGFPAPPVPTECAAEACRGAASEPGSSPTAGSASQHGSGNERPVQHRRHKKRPKKRHRRSSRGNPKQKRAARRDPGVWR
jgi:hypothetical protein